MSDKIAKNLTQEYWDKLLSNNTSLKGVGWPNWPESYNLILYKKYLKGFENIINDLQKKYDFSIDSKKLVFEAGPGTGFYTSYFWKAGIKTYTGADLSETSVLKLSIKFPEFSFIRKNISDNDEFIKNNKDKFDLICIIDVLLHITDDQKFRDAIDNLSYILKPNGYLIIGDAISVYSKINHSEGSKYNTDVSRHINYLNELLSKHKINLLNIYHRHNFLLNKNFDYKYSIFNKINKPFFYLLNGGLSLFRNNEFIGKIVGYPLSALDSIITPFQKYSKNSKFLLYKKLN